MPKTARASLRTDQLRRWAEALDTKSMRAVRAAKDELEQVADPELLAWAALALARLARVDDVPAAARAIAHAAEVCRDDALRGRLLLALAEHESGPRSATTLALRASQCPDPEVAALAELRLVRLSQRTGQLDEARERVRALRSRLGSARSDFVGASLDALEGMQHLAERRMTDALVLLEKAYVWAAGQDVDLEASEAAGMMGNVLHDLGDLAGALGWYDLAIDHAARLGPASTVLGVFTLYRGWVLQELGRCRAAAHAYRRAATALITPRARAFRLHADALAAALAGKPASRLVLARAATELERLGDQARARAVRAMGVASDAARAGAARAGPATSLALLRCERDLRFEPTSDDERIALRIARAALAHALRRTALRRAELRLRPDGASFARGRRLVSLARHPAHARILVALATGAFEGHPVRLDEIVAAGWPGERMRADAAKHRAQVAISSLRAKGLPVTLGPGGYELACRSIGLLPED